MPTIKKISIQQHNKERYNVFFDKEGAEQYAFSVSEAVLIKHGLKKGMELTDLEMEEIFYNEEIQKAYHYSINYLSYRMRSVKEVRDYLTEKGFTDEIIQEVLIKLKNQKYLNDEAFSESFVKTQINTTDKGPTVIKRTLIEKGVQAPLIEKALSHFSVDEQLEKATKLCEKWARQKKNSSKSKLKVDLQVMLMRKGYAGDIVGTAIDEVLVNMDGDQEWEALLVQGEKALKKYRDDPFKLKQFLYRKGFQLELIDRFIAEKMTNED